MTNLKENTSLWNDLTDEQSEKLVGGVGIGATPGMSAGVQGWFGNGEGPPDPSDHGLFGAGFVPGGMTAGGSGNNIIVPTKP